MKLCGISDTHGQHRSLTIEPCDILCIAGDISPLEIQGRKHPMLEWLVDDFIPWCESLPVDKVFLVPGNHELAISHMEPDVRELFEGTKIVYLIDELATYGTYKIWGTPWCSIFGNWAYMKLPEFEEHRFMKMPENVDILIAHDPPYGACDICLEHPWGYYEHIGNKELAKVISIRKPKIVLCGHLHTGKSRETFNETINVYNVSVVNEQYKLFREPLYLEI